MVLNERFSFYYGPQVGCSYRVSKFSDTKSTSLVANLGCIAGISFKAIDRIYISLEAVPSLDFYWSKSGDNSSSQISLGNSANAGLIIGVRF